MEISTKDLRAPKAPSPPQVKERLESWSKPQLSRVALEQRLERAYQRKVQLSKKVFKSSTRKIPTEESIYKLIPNSQVPVVENKENTGF